jgi:hypothetical protein
MPTVTAAIHALLLAAVPAAFALQADASSARLAASGQAVGYAVAAELAVADDQLGGADGAARALLVQNVARNHVARPRKQRGGRGGGRAVAPPPPKKKATWKKIQWWKNKKKPATKPVPKKRPTASGRATSDVGGAMHQGLSTFFDGMGSPYGGCGIGAQNAVDDTGKPLPFVAVNTLNPSAPMTYFGPGKDEAWNEAYVGMFQVGANCGRWMKITLGENCVGGGNGDTPCTAGGGARLLRLVLPWLLCCRS